LTKLSSKQIIPVVFILVASLFVFIGITQLGFWSDINGPMPGFFPTVMGCIMILASAISLIQSKNEKKAQYFKDDFLVPLGAVAVILASFIIGLIPSALLYVILWLKIIEKENWKNTLKVFAVVSIIIIGVFVLWLQIPFPKGVIGEFVWGWFN
jgi:hypothetical protein